MEDFEKHPAKLVCAADRNKIGSAPRDVLVLIANAHNFVVAGCGRLQRRPKLLLDSSWGFCRRWQLFDS